jgi:hypothetical protein
MPTTFNLRTCHELLKTNPKTFHRWLDKAGIQPQENPADPRELLVMKADVITLAQQHNRKLPDWFHQENTEPPVPISLEGVAEQVVAFEQQTIQRFDQMGRVLNQIEQSLLQLMTLVQDIMSSHHKEPQVAPSIVTQKLISHEADQMQQAPVTLTSPVSTSPSSQEGLEQTSSPKAKPRLSSAKKRLRGKSLPRTMIPLRVFAEQHHISLKAAEAAGQRGKLTIQQGKWLYQSRYITKALRAQGQQEFYEYFHTHKGFVACEHCPHGSFLSE